MSATVLTRVRDLKKRLNISVDSTNKDEEILRLLTRVSLEFERATHISQAAVTATRYLDGNGGRRLLLPLGQFLVSVSALAVDDDRDETYGLALVQSTDYWLYPDNESQKWAIESNPNSVLATSWQNSRRSVRVTGTWGYSATVEVTLCLANEAIDATETQISVISGEELDPGETVLMDSEQMYIVARPSASSLTVERGVNGTTAAAHATSTAFSRRRYPMDVEEAVLERARSLWLDGIGSTESEDARYAAGLPTGGYARWMQVVGNYKEVVLA